MNSLGTWIAAFLTLAFLSMVFKDNIFYRFAENLYVGCFAGYSIVVNWYSYVKPTLFTSIAKEGKWSLAIPVVIGLLIYTKYFKSTRWLSRYSMAFMLGIGSGYVLTKDFKSLCLTQITATFQSLTLAKGFLPLVSSLVLVLGVLSVLSYFFFTAKRKGLLGYSSQFGKWIMMIGFGTAFGSNVMGRLSLLLGRLQFLLIDWLGVVK